MIAEIVGVKSAISAAFYLVRLMIFCKFVPS
jgi:hypothetical protein